MPVHSDVRMGGGPAAAEVVMGSVTGGLRWCLDRMLSVGYGLVYDYIFERFGPYQRLQLEVLELVEAAAPDRASRHEVQVLDAGCGPGNFTFLLAEAGFSALGIDPYGPVLELAREKRRARRLAHLAFRQGDLALGAGLRDASFDQVVSIHTLYAHPAPQRLLQEAYRVLKPGGHAVLVNHTRQVGFAELRERDGLSAATRGLCWVVPNSVFEATRRPFGPHYWNEEAFGAHVRDAGFTVLETRRTFLHDSSLLVWARKDTAE
jgi:SAM-dependent methyltransferase